MARYGVTITVDTGKMPSSQTDFVWLATEDDFPTAAIDAGLTSIDNGGGNLRCYTDDTKATQLPIEVVSFVTGGTPSIQVWGLSPTLNVASTVYIEADTVATTQPAVGAAFGRNATWVDYSDVYHFGGFAFSAGASVTNSTGGTEATQRNTALGGPPTLGASPFGDAIDYGTSDWWIEGLGSKVSNKATCSISWWFKDPDYSSDRQMNKSSVANEILIWADNADRMDFIANGVGNRVSNANTGSLTGWNRQVCQVDGTNQENIVNDITPIATRAYTGAMGTTGGFEMLSGGSGDIDQAAEVRIGTTTFSQDHLHSEYNNQSDPATFWTVGAWEDQDSGGFTILPSSIASAEVFGSPTIVIDRVLAPTSISSLEALGSPVLLAGGVSLSPSGIVSQEALGEPSLIYAQLVVVNSGITSQEQFGIAIIQDGVGVVIPINSRDTYQKIASYLDSTGKFVSTQNNDIIVEWLKSEGIDAKQFNDLFFKYWEQQGFTGAYNDKWKKWKNS